MISLVPIWYLVPFLWNATCTSGSDGHEFVAWNRSYLSLPRHNWFLLGMCPEIGLSWCTQQCLVGWRREKWSKFHIWLIGHATLSSLQTFQVVKWLSTHSKTIDWGSSWTTHWYVVPFSSEIDCFLITQCRTWLNTTIPSWACGGHLTPFWFSISLFVNGHTPPATWEHR